jgi:membrane-associated phospholipid phosphatase
MNRSLPVLALLAFLGLHSATAHADRGPELAATDVLTGVIPLGALAVAWWTDDVEGQKQWLRNTILNQAVAGGLRLAFDQTSLGERPNGKRYGFPSGHEAFVMSGASFLGERYGWKWGVPAYVLSAYVGYVRVREDKHHTRDVVAAAAVAYGVALLTVTPEHATHLAPVVGPDFIGIRWERSF